MQKTIFTILIIFFGLQVFRAFPVNVAEDHFENGYVSFIRGDYGTALEEFDRFIALEQQSTHPRLTKIAMMFAYRGACFEKLRLTGRAIQEYQEALDIYSTNKDSVEITTCLMKLGRLYFMEKKPDQALLFVRMATQYFETMKWAAMLQSAHFLVGEIEFERKNFESSQEYYERSLEVNNRIIFRSECTYLEGETWFNLAKIALGKNFPLSADTLLRKAEKEFRMYVNDLPQYYNQ